VELAASKLTDVASARERRRFTRWWWIASIALFVIGAALILLALHGPRVGPSIPGPIGRTSPSGRIVRVPEAFAASSPINESMSPDSLSGVSLAASPVVPSNSTRSSAPGIRAARELARSRPIHLTIPVIGLSERLSELGLNKNGTVQVPKSWTVPGWYKLGPSPGQRGSAVILGHVDSVSGPAAFYQLSKLRPGNRVSVKLADGKMVQFRVIGLRMYLKKNFPDRLVYGPRSYSALQLVTCGGVFDSGTHHYLSNLVVFTERVTS
jgi:hypothetical protein